MHWRGVNLHSSLNRHPRLSKFYVNEIEGERYLAEDIDMEERDDWFSLSRLVAEWLVDGAEARDVVTKIEKGKLKEAITALSGSNGLKVNQTPRAKDVVSTGSPNRA